MFRVGDVVTRDGTDLQRISEISSPDLMLFVCIREPAGDPPWCRVGEDEWNVPWRYSYPDELTIEAGAAPYRRLDKTQENT